MEDNKKKGLGMVLEGGGMRGLYTAGVLDELMEQGIYAQILKQGNPAIRNAEWETGWMWNGCAHQLPCHWLPDR